MFFSCGGTQTDTITNTSGIPLTWHVSGVLTALTVTPPGSTIPAAGSLDVSFVPNQGTHQLPSMLSIDADSAPSQTIQIFQNVNEASVVPPPDIDFGNVPVHGAGSGPTVFIPIPSITFGLIDGLAFNGGSGEPTFEKSGVAPGPQTGGFGWTLQFNPPAFGPQETTLTFIKFSGTVCQPNSFKAHGVGVSP
jgi:hypothetical protein